MAHYWSGSKDTDWDDVDNWRTGSGGSSTPGAIPGTGDDVIFDAATMAGPCDFTLAHGTTIRSLEVKDGLSADTLINTAGSKTLTIKNTMTISEHSVFGFANTFTFIFDGSGTQLTVFDGAGSSSGVATTHIKLDLNAGESMFSSASGGVSRGNITFDFTPNSGTNTMTLVDGQYPNMTNIGTVSAKYITSDANATAFNTYGSVDILNWSGGSVTSTARNIYDYDKEFFFEALTSINETFQFGHTTARFKSGGANLRLPVFSDYYTNFGSVDNARFHVQYNKVIIEAGDNASYYCYIQEGKTLYCNELIVRDGGRLYGPAEGATKVTARIESVKRPTIHGDWNFRQVADGIYESVGTSPIEPVTFNYNGKVGIGTGDAAVTVPLHIKDSGTGDTVVIESTDVPGTSNDFAPHLVLFRSGNPTSTTNSDAGQIIFRANQSAASGGGTKEHASIKTEFNTDTHSARLRFNTLSSSGSGNDYEYLRFDGGVRDIVFNEEGRDIDFRVEGDNDRFMFVVDANVDRASIGMNFSKLLHAKFEMGDEDSQGNADMLFRSFIYNQDTTVSFEDTSESDGSPVDDPDNVAAGESIDNRYRSLAKNAKIRCNPSSGNITVSLPTGVKGERITIFNVSSSHTAQLSFYSGDSLGEAATGSFPRALSQYQVETYLCHENGKWILENFI